MWLGNKNSKLDVENASLSTSDLTPLHRIFVLISAVKLLEVRKKISVIA